MKFKMKWIVLMINFLILSCATPRNTQDIALVTDLADAYSSKVAERYYQTHRISNVEGDKSRYKLEYYFDGVKQPENCFMLEEKGFGCYIDFCNALIGAGEFGGCNNKLRHEVLFQSFLVEINTGEIYPLVNYQTSFLEHDDTVVWTRIYVGTNEFEKKHDFVRYENVCPKQERSFNATYSENLQDSIYFQTCILVKDGESSDRRCQECF